MTDPLAALPTNAVDLDSWLIGRAPLLRDEYVAYVTRRVLSEAAAERERMKGLVDAARNAVDIIEAVDNRAMAADGPVTPTREEMTDEEMRRIYRPLRKALDSLGGPR